MNWTELRVFWRVTCEDGVFPARHKYGTLDIPLRDTHKLQTVKPGEVVIDE
jgi:hypothetical protein